MTIYIILPEASRDLVEIIDYFDNSHSFRLDIEFIIFSNFRKILN